MMEIHPAHRSAPSGLWEAAMSVIGGIATRRQPRAARTGSCRLPRGEPNQLPRAPDLTPI